jgi:hypothetical protein
MFFKKERDLSKTWFFIWFGLVFWW